MKKAKQGTSFDRDYIESFGIAHSLSFVVSLIGLLLLSGCAEMTWLAMEDTPSYIHSPFRIAKIDVGDQAWGQNLLAVKVKNITNEEHPFWLHIGGHYLYSGHPGGFGMGLVGETVLFAPQEERVIEHRYWIPPRLGELSYRVKFVVPRGSTLRSQQAPFLVREYSVTYESPNTKCNELTPLPQFLKYDWAQKYREGAKIPPFRVFTTQHFVFYVLPGSPAENDIQNIKAEREKQLEQICDFLGTEFPGTINFFLFPDAPSKRWCMSHQGDGLAFDTTIAEIYNDTTRVAPAHEITHVVAAQIGNPPALLNEGLAVYMQEGHKWNDEHVDVTASKLLKNERLTPLTELITRSEIGPQEDDGEVAYPQSASFVKFIIERYGRNQFLRLYRTLKIGADDNSSRFEQVLGISLDASEKEWQTFLRNVKQ